MTAHERPRLLFLCLAIVLLNFLPMREVESVCPSVESQALLTLKANNTATSLSSWKPGSDCCHAWAGVTCNAAATHVTAINLTGTLQLRGGIIPTSFCNLSAIQEVNISMGNSATLSAGQIPDCIWSLTELRSLTIAMADIANVKGNISAQVCGLKNLTHLAVYGNLLVGTRTLPACLWQMTQLEYLDLGTLYLHGEITPKLCDIRNLTYLILASNSLAPGYLPSCIWNLTKLERLDLAGLGLQFSMSPEVCNIKNLAYLDLTSNYVESGGNMNIPACIWGLTKLVHLDVNQLNLSGSFSPQMCDLQDLSVLYLGLNRFTGALPPCIWTLRSLQMLDLTGAADLSNVEVPSGGTAPSLISLGLTGTNMTRGLSKLILNFPLLVYLDIAQNGLTALPSWIQNAPSLEVLWVGDNQITTIPSWLEKLQSLNYLDVAFNCITTFASLPPSVQILYAEMNDLRSIPESFGAPNRSLVQLDLSYNHISHVSPVLGNLSALVRVTLSGNLLRMFPAILSSIPNLYELILDHNLFDEVPLLNSSQNSWASLRYLTLSNNSIKSTSGLCQMRQLLDLELSNISRAGAESALGCVRNMSQLIDFHLADNNVSKEFSTIVTSIHNLSNLEILYLSGNQISGNLSSLGNQFSALQVLDVSDNRLTGEIPAAFFSQLNFPEDSVVQLSFSNNQLQGQIPDFRWPLVNIDLDLSSNNFEGTLPSFATATFASLSVSNNNLSGSIPSALRNSKYMMVLAMAFNKFSGTIPAFLGDMRPLTALDLASNQFTGTIPEALGNCYNLFRLSLGNNSLHGSIPKTLGRFSPSLLSISLARNFLEGQIPASIGNCSSLKVLDLSHNNLTGTLPSTLEKLYPTLRVLTMGSNRLTGPFPTWIVSGGFAYLQVVDLSDNLFYGELPSLSIYPDLVGFLNGTNSENNDTLYVDGITISAKGGNLTITYFITVRTSFDVSFNKFTGHIPSALGGLPALKYLTLSGNSFTGSIPSSLSKLVELESLDLSQNSLSGTIPSHMDDIYGLSYFNVADNFLTGPIPSDGQFLTFPASFFENNTGLCGYPLSPCNNTGARAPTSSPGGHGGDAIQDWVGWEGCALGFGVGFSLIGLILVFSKRARSSLYTPHRNFIESKPYGAYMPKR